MEILYEPVGVLKHTELAQKAFRAFLFKKGCIVLTRICNVRTVPLVPVRLRRTREAPPEGPGHSSACGNV